MRILLIRHGDPDYSIDSLTETGKVEAEFLAEKLSKMKIDYIYSSTLGRAKDTASYTLKKMGREFDGVFEWLKEFPPLINRPDSSDKKISWDWLPQDWTVEEKFYKKDEWFDSDIMREGKVGEEYSRVVNEFDKLIEKHGYKRENNIYRAVNANDDVIAIFCHFGLICVLLSHLLGVSPMVLWHGFCAAPSSVTSVITEERREGIASFRVNTFGDVSHLYIKGKEPSFSARFCEMYINEDERHD